MYINVFSVFENKCVQYIYRCMYVIEFVRGLANGKFYKKCIFKALSHYLARETLNNCTVIMCWDDVHDLF